jgi:hypothetical protein
MARFSGERGEDSANKDYSLLEYLLLFQTGMQEVNRILQAGLSIFAAE